MGETKTWLGWHFLRTPGLLRGGGAAANDGDVETSPGPLKICQRGGLHASRFAADALRYNPGGWTLRRVELLGERIDHDNKSAALKRRVVFTLPAEKVRPVVLEWACWCAEQALALAGDDTEEQQVAILAGLLALEVARDVAASRDAADAADAAYDAATYAAYDAATYAADAAAAYAAADADAALAAYAARAAARAAADDDARAADTAAYDAAQSTQGEMRSHLRAELERRLLALAPEGP